MEPSRAAADKAMMTRCIELSRIAAGTGEYPFGTVIALDGQIVAEAVNQTIREDDVTRHAEVIALSAAQKAIGRQALRHATLYTNIEPCAMCCYCIREAWVGRVVYALSSPIMGGVSKWNILRDSHLSDCVPIFGPAPEVVSGMLLPEVQQAWRDWNPLVWELVKLRGILTAPEGRENDITVLPAHSRQFWHHAIVAFNRLTSKHARRQPEGGNNSPDDEPKTPSPQPSPQGEREQAVDRSLGREGISGVPSPLGEKDRMRGDLGTHQADSI